MAQVLLSEKGGFQLFTVMVSQFYSTIRIRYKRIKPAARQMRDEAMAFITRAYNMLMSDFSKKMIEN